MEEISERNNENEGPLKESETNIPEDSADDKVPCKPETSEDKCSVQNTVPEEIQEKDSEWIHEKQQSNMEEISERNKGNEVHLKESQTKMQEDFADDKVPCKPETSEDKCSVQNTVPEEIQEKDVSQNIVPEESKSNVEQCKLDKSPVKESPAVTMPGEKKKFVSRIPQPSKKLREMIEHKVKLSCGVLPSNQKATGEKNTYVLPETSQNISVATSPIKCGKQLKNEESQTETEIIKSPKLAESTYVLPETRQNISVATCPVNYGKQLINEETQTETEIIKSPKSVKSTDVLPETRQNSSVATSPINYGKQLKNEETQTETKIIKSPKSAKSDKPNTRRYIKIDTSASNQSTTSRIAREKIALINSFVHSADAPLENLDSITNLNTLQNNFPEEVTYSHQINPVRHETESKTENQNGGSHNLKCSSSGNLQAYASTSGFVSGATSTREYPLDAESTNISLNSALDEAEKVSSYNLTMIDAIRNVQYVLASMAFRDLKKCTVSLPLEIRRRKRKPSKRTQTTLVNPVDIVHSVQPGFEHFRRKHTYKTSGGGNGEILERHWTANDRLEEPSDNQEPQNSSRQVHNVVATIEHIEHILEMLLTVGYKITTKTCDSFGTSEVPTATHNAMSDVKTFLQPLKTSIGSSVPGEYFRPLMDAVIDTLTPAFNHLNDAVIALESPARGKNHLRLKLEKRIPRICAAEEMGSIDHVYNMANHGGNSNFLMNMLNSYNYPPANNSLTLRPGHNRASVHPMGLMEFQFLYDIQVIMTVDLGIIVFNRTNKKAVAISADGSLAGIKYRFGDCMQQDSIIDISVINPFHEVEKRARIMPKGILFQDEWTSVTYLVTSNNVTTCPTIYSSIPLDFLGQAFYSGSRYGHDFRRTCIDMLNFAKNEYTADGTQLWVINNVQMKQHSDGQLIIHKSNAEFTIILSPNRLEDFNSEEELMHSARLTTPAVHVTCSVTANERGRRHHFYIRQENKKVFSNDQKFVVRNGNQSAGVNKDHQITLHSL